jgi:hypothetical protein
MWPKKQRIYLNFLLWKLKIMINRITSSSDESENANPVSRRKSLYRDAATDTFPSLLRVV